VHPPEIVLGHDDLAGRHAERVGPPAGLVGPLAVGGATEPPGAARSGELGQRPVTPAASRCLGIG
jgi:hypothetical protein